MDVLKEAIKEYVEQNVKALINGQGRDIQVSDEFKEVIRTLIIKCDKIKL